jgi:hypothetical protein
MESLACSCRVIGPCASAHDSTRNYICSGSRSSTRLDRKNKALAFIFPCAALSLEAPCAIPPVILADSAVRLVESRGTHGDNADKWPTAQNRCGGLLSSDPIKCRRPGTTGATHGIQDSSVMRGTFPTDLQLPLTERKNLRRPLWLRGKLSCWA